MIRGTARLVLAAATTLLAMGQDLPAQEATADEIVARAVEAMGGAERIGAWETLRIRYDLPDHEGISRTEIRRPNLFRASRVVFDGERAALLPTSGQGGGEGQGVELVPAEEWKDVELDIAWSVPAFLDYPCEYLGRGDVLGHETHILGVDLPLGARIVYHIDVNDYLVLKAASDFTIRGVDYHTERLFTNHREVNGILFPHAFTYPGRQGEILTATVVSVEINPDLPRERFSLSMGEGAVAKGVHEIPRLDPVPFGHRVAVRSRHLGETRDVFIRLPEGYAVEDGPDGGRYPVLYVLDGGDYFEPVAGMVRFLTMFDLVPEMIVVAVPHRSRMNELTFSQANEEYGDWPASGGAESFHRFLEEELTPFIDASFRTHPFRILVGHSLGGLFAVESMARSPDLFQSTIALSPSLAWNQFEWLKAAGGLFEGVSTWRHSLLVSVEPKDEEYTRRLEAFQDLVRARAPADFSLDVTSHPEESHASVALPGLYHDLRKLFDGWFLEGEAWALGPDEVQAHFRGLSDRFGFEVPIPEGYLVDHALHGLTRHEAPDEAIELLNLCLSLYPGSARALAGLGEAYEWKGDRSTAREYYRRALELDPENTAAKSRLEALGGRPTSPSPW